MFTRSSASEPKPLEPTNNNLGLNVQRRPPMTDTSTKSVISNDLKIIGQGLKIISQGTLQVDGEVEGDVRGTEVIIGEKGRVTGTVAAERVIVRGMISGVIRGMTVTLQASSRVEGDIHHMSLAIEQGAEFDGRCKRPADASELNLDLDGSPVAAMPQPRPVIQRPCGRLGVARHRVCPGDKIAEGASRGRARLGGVDPLPNCGARATVAENRNHRKGGDPMSSGILIAARTLKLDHACVGAASSRA